MHKVQINDAAIIFTQQNVAANIFKLTQGFSLIFLGILSQTFKAE